MICVFAELLFPETEMDLIRKKRANRGERKLSILIQKMRSIDEAPFRNHNSSPLLSDRNTHAFLAL